jgi:4-hydroxybenzoate polyprenyltransferase
MLTRLLKLVRWEEWAYSKIPPLFAAGFSWLLVEPSPTGRVQWKFLAWILFSALYLAYGYAVNDFFDQAVDRKAGKPNAISALSTSAALGWLLAIFVVGILLLMPFSRERWIGLLAIGSYGLATVYSMPPLRFKERGVAGILVAAVAQRFLPLLVGMALFGAFDAGAWILTILFTLIGIRWILLHQLIDLGNDRQSNVSTFTRSRGYDRTLQLMREVIFPLEIVCLIGWLILTLLKEAALLWLILTYGLWLLARLAIWRGIRPAFNWTAYWLHPLSDFYEIVWPVFSAILLVAREPAYVGLMLFLLAWQLPFLFRQLGILQHIYRVKSQKSLVR